METYKAATEHAFLLDQLSLEKDYWLKKLAGDLRKSYFPYSYDESRPSHPGAGPDQVDFSLPGTLVQRLLEVSNKSDFRLFVILTSLICLLLNKYSFSGINDIIIGFPILKQDSDDEDFVNTVLALRNRLHDSMTIKELFLRVNRVIREAIAHQNYPIETLLYQLNMAPDEGGFPLFDVAVMLRNIHEEKYLQPVNPNITFDFFKVDGSIAGILKYNPVKYKQERIERVVRHYIHLLEAAVFNVDAKIGEIDILPDDEKKQLLTAFNNLDVAYPRDETIHKRFEMNVEKFPLRTALQLGDRQLTYRELNRRANHLAASLKRKGTAPGQIVAITIEPSLEMITGILGILKAGGAYLPISPGTPMERCRHILDDAGVSIILSNHNSINKHTFGVLQDLRREKLPLHKTAVRPQVASLDQLPFPDRSLVNYEKFNRYIGLALVKNNLALQATRGCPYNCAFCHKIWPKSHVFRSAENIYAEVKLYYDIGVKRFAFVDDIFNLDKENSSRFFRLIIENGLKVQFFFPAGVRGDILTPEYIDLMVEAGTTAIGLSLETASPRLHKLIGKNLNIEKLRKNTDYIAAAHPQVILELFTMLGFPTETEEEAVMTLDFIKSVRWIDFPVVNVLKIYPNTDMEKLALESGISHDAIFRSQNMAFHELPETLPFDKKFALKYQADYLNDYFLSKERLLAVLPNQMRCLTEDEIVQKYDSYLPVDIQCFADLLDFTGIRKEELGRENFLDESDVFVPGLNKKIEQLFPKETRPAAAALRVLFLDLSQLFSGESDILYDVVEAPLGLMCIMTYLNQQLGSRITGKIVKSRIDFNSFDELKSIIEEFNPGLIGLRTLTYFKDFFHRTASLIRQWGFDVPVIAGGPYATSDYEAILRDRNIDLVVLGEGEITTAELIGQIIENGGTLPGERKLMEIPGIVFVSGGKKPERNYAREVFFLDEFNRDLPAAGIENITAGEQPADLAYVLYTSGTTGKPKGMLIEHENVVRLLFHEHFLFDFDHTDTWTMFHAFNFDFSVWEMYGALLYGGKVVMVPELTAKDPERFLRLLKKEAVTVLNQTPPAFYYLMNEELKHSDKKLVLKYIIFGGDVLKPAKLSGWKAKYSDVRFINMYGITETTVHVTFKEIGDEEIFIDSNSIGRPLPTLGAYVMNRDQKLLPLGVPGELVVAGGGVGRGYLNRVELTADKFVASGGQGAFLKNRPPSKEERSAFTPISDLDSSEIPHKTFDEGQESRSVGAAYMRPEPGVGAGAHHVARDLDIHENQSPVPLEGARAACYRSGDLVRIVENGEIEYLGRIDNQVQIRGFRVERGEIENHLSSIEAVKEAVVTAGKDETGDTYLCAYIVSDEEIEGVELRDRLAMYLPDYMIPSYFVRLDRLPLTPNGKIDKNELPEPGLLAGGNYIAPVNGTEEHLAGIWSEVLNVNKDLIGRDANFFELGGHSLKVTVLIAKIHKTFNVKVPIVEVFKGKSLKELAEYIEAASTDVFRAVEAVEKKEYYDLSAAQKRLYILQKLTPQSTGYNIPLVFYPDNNCSREKLHETFKKIIHRHESFRTGLREVEDQPVQVIMDKVDFKINVHEITGGDDIQDIIDAFKRPFDLGKAPFFRVSLIISANITVLLIDMHHVISDMTSHLVLQKEFTALYSGEELPALRLQYKDYSAWQSKRKDEESMKEQEAYWLAEFKDEIPVLDLPFDFPRPLMQSFAGDIVNFELGIEEISALNRIAKSRDATTFMILLAIFFILLAKLSNREHVIVGTPVAGRRHTDVIDIIGMFVNTLAIKSNPAGDYSFTGFLKQLRENILHAFENQEYQFEELVEKLSIERDLGRNPVFDVMFNLVDFEEEGAAIDMEEGDEAADKFKPGKAVSKFDLSLSVVEMNDKLLLSFEYCTELFKKTTIERFADFFKRIVSAAVADAGLKISEIEIISQAEKQRILDDCNRLEADFPVDRVLHELFREQAARTPGKTALISEDIQLTYEEVDKRSDRLAAFLTKRSPEQNRIAGIMVERSLEMVIGIYGILKSGAAYLPIDPAYPLERIDYMLRDSSAAVLLTQKRYVAALNGRYDTLDLEDPGLYIKGSDTPPGRVSSSQDPAYVIYTSGSTGQPKGVLVEHKSINNTLFALQRKYPFTAPDVYLLKTSYVFDVSVAELFGWFVGEGRLAILEKGGEKEPSKMLRAIERFDISHINFIPSMFNAFLGLLEGAEIMKMSPLKYIFLAGEALYPAVVEKFRSINPGCGLENIYGPTEASIYGSWYSLSGWDGNGNIPIGTPLDNVDLYVLDRYGSLQPIGIPGELYIAGAGLARGYLNQPELTADKFDNNKSFLGVQGAIFQKSPLGFLYKTGDVAKRLPDGPPAGGAAKATSGGIIEFLGRIDSQVKIRGYRVELGEIESRLLDHENVNEAVVLDREDQDGGKYLCAYIAADSEISPSRLREYLKESLPGYMVPAYFIRLDKIPMTAGGKIDRQLLSGMEVREPGGEMEYVRPRNELEQRLVEIWQDVLGRENISIKDNFFMLGGDSIKTIRIASRLRIIGYRIEMVDIFTNPTIAGLSKKLKKSARLADQSVVTGVVPLIPIQAEFFQSKKAHPAHYNQAVMLISRKMFDEETVRVIFGRILEHHDALRMTFKRAGEMVIQTNNGVEQSLALQTYDLRGVAENEAAALSAEKADEIQAGIDLEKGPLMRLGLFKMDDGNRLLIVMHHLVIDGVSWRVLFEDMETLYRQYKNGDPLQLPLKSDSFKLWAEKLKEYAASAERTELQKEKDYWRQLESEKVDRIESDFEGSNFEADRETLSFRLSAEETENLLTQTNFAYGTEINDILLTAMGLGFYQTFGIEKLAIALEGHGREQIIPGLDIDRTMGWFTCIYPVILNMSYADDLSRQIRELKETLRRVPAKGMGYGILKYLTSVDNAIGPDFGLSPQVSFNYLGQFDTDVKDRMFSIAKEPPGNLISPGNHREYELDISGMITGGRLVMSVSYSGRRYEQETVDTLIRNYKKKLCDIIAHCASREEKVLTPGDLTYKGLTIDYLDDLQERYAVLDIYPLSPMQDGMLFHSLYDSDSAAYFEQISYRFKGDLEIGKINKSLNALMARYDILRSSFIHEGSGRPLQVVLKDREIGFLYKDIREIGDMEKRNRHIEEFKKRDKQAPFHLQDDVLMRVAIHRLGDREYEFTWSFHHILMDGWCIGILLNEFFEIYAGYLEGRPYRLPAVKQYGVYIDWLQRRNDNISEAYWREYLSGYNEAANLPRPGSLKKQGENYINEEVTYELSETDTRALKDLSGRNNVTLNTTIQAIWGILVGKYTGKRDVVFGAVVSGRPAEIEGIEGMVGLFINTIPVRITFGEDARFTDLMHRIQEEAVGSDPYHYYPLAKIRNTSALKSSLSDHIMAFENYPVAGVIEESGSKGRKPGFAGKGFELTGIDVFEQTHYDLNFLIIPGSRMKAIFKFNSAVFGKAFVERMAGHFGCLLKQVVRNSDGHVNEFSLITGKEKQAVLHELNRTAASFPENKMVHELFMDQVERNPGRIALSFRNRQLSYNELNRLSGLSARLLQEKGVDPGSIVAILMEKSLEMPVVILGILKSGSAYLPIDPSYPQARITYMLLDSGVNILFTSRDSLKENDDRNKTIGNWPGGVIYVEGAVNSAPGILSPLPSDTEAPAYVIYTSGTTGNPKGAVITHRNLVSLLVNDRFMFDFGSSDVWTMFHSCCFDFSVWEMYGALLYGGKLIIIPGMISKDTEGFLNLLRCEQVTVLNQTPTAFYHLSHYELLADAKELRIRYVIFGGEALNPAKLKDWQNRYPESRLINMYGITETTVHVTYKELNGADIEKGLSVMGNGLPSVNTYIMDGDHNILPVGVPGELCVGGPGVCRGYLDRPELTEEKFVENPHRAGEILYKSGDLARFLENGELEYLGRIDQQVKIRGYRVESGEIENHLLGHEAVREAVVLPVELANKRGETNLCAYLVSEIELSISGLREYLKILLPDYMVPAYFMQVEEIPVTANGKVDRKALPLPEIKAGAVYTGPREEVESILLAIWSQVLGTAKETIDIDSDFFELGGHSLDAIAVIAKVQEKLDVNLPLAEIFSHPTLKEQAEFIKGMAEVDYISIQPICKQEYYSLSYAQERLYYLQQMHPNSISLNISRSFYIGSGFSEEKLLDTFLKLINRHDSLRTEFRVVNDKPVQVIRDSIDFEIELLNGQKDWDLRQLITVFARPFDLNHAPLLRAGLIQVDRGYFLVIDMHHIICDEISLDVMQKEFLLLLDGKEFPVLRLQYRDFEAWQKSTDYRELMNRQEKYWLGMFPEGIPPLDLPADFKRPTVKSYEGEAFSMMLSKQDSFILKDISRKEGVTLFMTIFALFNVLFSKLCGQEDITVGMAVEGRRNADLKNLIGIFVRLLPVRNNAGRKKTFKEFLAQVKERILEAYENQEYKFERLLEKRSIKPDKSRHPLFDVVLNVLNRYETGIQDNPVAAGDRTPENNGKTVHGNKMDETGIPEKQLRVTGVSQYDFTVTAVDTGESILLSMQYCTKLFRVETIERFLKYFRNISSSLADTTDIRLSDIDIISEEEQSQILNIKSISRR